MKKDFVTYVNEARNAVGSSMAPAFEKYFQEIDGVSPLLGQLDQVVYVFDLRNNSHPYISDNAERVMGWSHQYFMEQGPMTYMENLFHKEDFENIVTRVFPEGLSQIKYLEDYEMSAVKIVFSYRMLQPDGEYRLLLNQFSHVLEDEERNPLVIMGTTTDISQLGIPKETMARVVHRNRKGNWNTIYERHFPFGIRMVDYGLTPKEMEIIRFIHDGKSSKEIAVLTNRSEETIKSQRKSILSKTECATMTDVIVLAKGLGWF